MMNVIDANTTGILNFGYQGEKDRTIVRFDIADIVNAFPGGTPTLAYKAPGSNAYSPIHIEFDGTIATWVLDRTDTNKSGMGMCQLIYTNGAIVKTRKWKTYVEESVDGEDDLLPPPDWEDWKNELLQLGNTIVQAVSAYNDMDAEATALPAGSNPTARIDHTGEIPILQLGLPEPPSGGAIQSVNGKTGVVELNAADVNALPKIDMQLIENYFYNFETETYFERRMTPSGDPYDFEFIAMEVVVNPGGTVGNYGVITFFDETSDPQSMFECSRVNASQYKSHFGGFMLPIGGDLFLPIHFITTNTGNPNTLAAKSHWAANNTITHFREIKKWKGLRIDAMTGSGEIRIWAGNRR